MPSRTRAKGEGTIVKRKDGRFEGRLSFSSNGRIRRRPVVYGKTKAEVATKLRKLRARYAKGASQLRVGDYLREWLADGCTRWEPQTYRTYSACLAHAISRIGERKVASLLPSDIKVLLREMQDDGVGAYTRKRTLTTLKSALRQLVLEEELERNPCDPIKPPKVTPKDFHVPTPAEIKLLLTLAKPFWLLALLLVSFTCTMRSGEIFALYWTQVDLDEGTIDVNKSLAVGWDKKVVRKAPKNKYSRRIIYMPAVTVAALRKLTSDQAKEGYGGPWVFPNEVGGPLQKNNFRSRHWVPLLRKAGLQYVKPYAGRHAGNSILISQGEDPLAIARRMGQADTRMAFDVYGHLFEGFGRRSASRMEKGLEEAGIKPGAFDL